MELVSTQVEEDSGAQTEEELSTQVEVLYGVGVGLAELVSTQVEEDSADQTEEDSTQVEEDLYGVGVGLALVSTQVEVV